MERETEKELFPYVFRVVCRLLRRTAPTRGGDYSVSEVARRVTRAILQRDHGTGAPETERIDRTIHTTRDMITQAD